MITGYYIRHCTSQDMIMGNDVLITPILHKESSWYHAQLCKSKLFIQMERRSITLHHSVKLKYPESQLFPLLHAMLHQCLSDMVSPQLGFNRVAGIADMAAAPHIIGMENIQSHDFSSPTVIRNPCK